METAEYLKVHCMKIGFLPFIIYIAPYSYLRPQGLSSSLMALFNKDFAFHSIGSSAGFSLLSGFQLAGFGFSCPINPINISK